MEGFPTKRMWTRLICGVMSLGFLLACGSVTPTAPGTQSTDPPGSNCVDGSKGYTGVAGTPPVIQGCALFPANNPWNADVSNYCVDPNSAAYISSINQNKQYLHPDWGTDPTYGIPFVVVPRTQPLVNVVFNQYADESDFGSSGGGCTTSVTSACYPFPPNAPVEGGSSSTGDRHVLTLLADSAHNNCTLYEVWEGVKDTNDNNWTAANGAIFNLRANTLRRDGWTSADAAGLPILPGLARYDEVAAGVITHALRLTVSKTQAGYIHPATHFASNSTDPSLPPMGLRLRLKASYDISSYTGQSKIILNALKKYGLIVADNGSSWYITGAPDHRWDDNDLDQLKQVPGSEFEVVATGPIQTQ